MTTKSSIPVWDEEYRSKKPTFERLASEVKFALASTTTLKGIKIHSVTSRVKTAESIADKARRKELDEPLGQVEDIVGIRVVALFLSDLPRLDDLIQESFEIHASENKVTEGDPASFGYMSVHYLAKLTDQHSGPRYDDLKSIQFEIQTRTVVMDAWANVSHYLDYKGESSVPDELRRDFFALSGLFYVADQHFEIFADRARQSQKQAEKTVGSGSDENLEINLDTMAAYLARRYPGRKSGNRPSISELVEELAGYGYKDFGVLGAALDRGHVEFLKFEKKYPPGFKNAGRATGKTPREFAPVGAVRVTLTLVDQKYAKGRGKTQKHIKEFALWGKAPR